MSLTTLESVLHHSLKDLLSAEKQFRDALPKLSKAATNPDLASALLEHRDETVHQIERLERCFELLGKAPRSEKCEAAEGLVAEAKSILDEGGEAPAFDVAIVGAARKVEHYEIVAYSEACELAKSLGHDELEGVLRETLQEEQVTDSKLHKLGERLVMEAMRNS
jgi:ferritin-like metal-binding protein YciE